MKAPLNVMMGSRTLREKIAESLRESIVKGELRPGERLQEIEIAAQYQTSRTPVREALRQLESEGFLLIKPRRGAVVAPITTRDIQEFYELKSLLEGYAAEKATPQLADRDIDRMERMNDELRRRYERSDIAGMISVHNQFHEVFIHACGNERLAILIKSLVKQFQRYRIALSHTDAVEDSIRIHGEIIQAFRQRNAARAAELVRQNSLQGSEALLARLKMLAH